MTIKIGVLGGIGPEATGEFYSKLIKTMQEKGLIESNQDFPQIIINSIPAPELIYEKITENELLPYINGLKELDNYKPDFIVMVCNTIHLYYDKLQSKINAPILDLKKELKNYLIKNKISSAFIIGTPNTIKQGLYRFDEIKSYEPNEEEIKQLSDSIFNFNKGYKKQDQIQKIKQLCDNYLKIGAQTIILGCTEFALMLENENFPKINTIDILVDSTIEKIQNTNYIN